MTRTVLVVMLAACGRINFDDTGGTTASRCVRPMPPDLTGATTLTTCDEPSVRAAIKAGGAIVLDCGAPTIALGTELVVANDTVIDARGATFDGQLVTRIFHVPRPGASLTLIDAVVINGVSTTSGGGILIEDGSLTVFWSSFADNQAVMLSPSDGGGAIAALPASATVAVYDSMFANNIAANGGAIQAFGELTIVGSQFSGNRATGTGGDMVQGGAGGALNATGTGDLSLCDTTFASNSAGWFGGALFRVSIDGQGVDSLDRVRIYGNGATSSSGGAYFQDTALRMRQVSVVSNSGAIVGGLWVQNQVPFDAENIFISDNTLTMGLGAGLRLEGPGRLAFSTIANNHAQCPSCFAAAIEGGEQVMLVGTVIANNQADAPSSPVSCRLASIDGGANFQWPAETPLCAAGARVVDPLLGGLTGLAGPSGPFFGRAPARVSPVVGQATGCPAVDLLGHPRPTPCAAGAVEP